MTRLHRLRNRIVDGPDSIAARSRERRWSRLAEAFPNLEEMNVLDLGGTVESWRRSPVRPGHVHVVNLEPTEPEIPSWAETDRADACDLPAHIRDRRYDLVFSNSVIEHVGGYLQRLKFAESVRRAAPRYWVQSPYRYFPVEPHWVFPGMQFLPLAARWRVARHWPLVHTPPTDDGDALRSVLAVELLGRTELAFYFPDARVLGERIAGVTKSLIAVKG